MPEWGGVTLTKGEDGAWVGTTRPLDEGFHYYRINIDGADVPEAVCEASAAADVPSSSPSDLQWAASTHPGSSSFSPHKNSSTYCLVRGTSVLPRPRRSGTRTRLSRWQVIITLAMSECDFRLERTPHRLLQ